MLSAREKRKLFEMSHDNASGRERLNKRYLLKTALGNIALGKLLDDTADTDAARSKIHNKVTGSKLDIGLKKLFADSAFPHPFLLVTSGTCLAVKHYHGI